VKRLFAAARRYAAADDPRVAAANFVALVLAWNTPFYPLYLVGTAGAEIRSAAWLTLCVFPIFLAVPLVTKWYHLRGRVLLTVAGIGNTLFCTWLLGEASGTQLFLLPCITLAALVFRRTEPIALFSMLGLPILAGVSLNGRYPVSPFACSGESCGKIVWLNAISVAVLAAFLGLLATGMTEQPTKVTARSAGDSPTRP
jgi:hypothetical protein